MSGAKGLFDRPEDWIKEFNARLTAYDDAVSSHRADLDKFEAKKKAELEERTRDWVERLRASNARLFEVAPISPRDVDSIPTRRAAYSDRTAALLAKVAMLAYIDFEDSAKRSVLEGALTHGRVKLLETLSAGDTEALVAETDKFVVVAFRGTSSRRDIWTDLNVFTRLVEVEERKSIDDEVADAPAVKVHAGFYDAFRNIENKLRHCLEAQKAELPIYLTGHSLGGALALVAAAALGGHSKLGDRLAAVYTFGAPRAGGASFPIFVKAPHYRVVNSGDAVPLVPPNWLSGYRHTGTPVLLKKNSVRPSRRRPWGSALLLALQSVLLWPVTRNLRLRRAHDVFLYVERLERIARHRGKWT